MSEINDVIIVGSGPSGYTAAIYAARAQLNPLMFEGEIGSGGALMNTTDVENFPGFPTGIQGPELMENKLRPQAERFGARIVLQNIVELDLSGAVKSLIDGSGTKHYAKAVILSMGSAYRELGLPDEKRLSGHGVSWCATCDGFFFRGEDVVVAGGGDSALEEATFLTRFARSVTVVHRRDELRASKFMQTRAFRDLKIQFVWDCEIEAVLGATKVSGVTIRNVRTGALRDLASSGLFIAVGHKPRSELVADQLALDSEGYVQVEGRTQRTNIAGVFACGDLVDHSYRQAVTAAGTGCDAALDAERYLASQLPNDATEAQFAPAL